MAKVSAPLLSFTGTGQIGKSMVFGSWRGVPYARRYVVPANPQTAAQTAVRNTFATLREMWKLLAADGRAPWDAFATGRSFLGLNSFVGENVRVLNPETDMNLFIGSPGARGGFPPVTVSAATGSGSGEIDVTVTPPSVPAGWTVDAIYALGFPDQDVHSIFGGPLVVGDETPPSTNIITLAGLGSGVACQAAGWVEYTKPNTDKAYSVSITDQATSGV